LERHLRILYNLDKLLVYNWPFNGTTNSKYNNIDTKKDKDTSNISNWRSISLVNIDYKIAAKVIANRLKKVLNTLINKEHSGFLKGRYIGENVRTLVEIIEHVEDNEQSGLLFFSYFLKAFDSLNHRYLFKCLYYFNLGNSFINWIKLLYALPQSCVTNNGFFSSYFKISKGDRQGCPLSLYFV